MTVNGRRSAIGRALDVEPFSSVGGPGPNLAPQALQNLATARFA
jgi:hypothetical protein